MLALDFELQSTVSYGKLRWVDMSRLTSEVGDELQSGLKIRWFLTNVCSDKILQVCVETGLKDSKECIANCVNLTGFACKLGHGWNRGAIRLSNNSRFMFGDLESIFIQRLRNILLPNTKSALVGQYPGN